MTLRERVKHLCKEHGISMNKLENELNFGKGYISKLGSSQPNVNKLQQIADYFSVSLDYLMAIICHYSRRKMSVTLQKIWKTSEIS